MRPGLRFKLTEDSEDTYVFIAEMPFYKQDIVVKLENPKVASHGSVFVIPAPKAFIEIRPKIYRFSVGIVGNDLFEVEASNEEEAFRIIKQGGGEFIKQLSFESNFEGAKLYE